MRGEAERSQDPISERRLAVAYMIVASGIAFLLGFVLCAVLAIGTSADGAKHPISAPTKGSDGAGGTRGGGDVDTRVVTTIESNEDVTRA